MEVEVKKLFNGFASVRDYIIDAAVHDRRDLVIVHKGQKMRVSLDRLKSKWQMHGRQFKSKFNDQTYTLYDFRFEADEDKNQREDDQPTLL